jgi:hypothetical protein
VPITPIRPTAVSTSFPQHAKNHMNEESQLPASRIGPHQAANAIPDAATHAKHDVKTGTMPLVNTKTAVPFPEPAEKIAAKLAGRRQYGEAPRYAEGTLCEPGGSGNIHGSGETMRH